MEQTTLHRKPSTCATCCFCSRSDHGSTHGASVRVHVATVAFGEGRWCYRERGALVDRHHGWFSWLSFRKEPFSSSGIKPRKTSKQAMKPIAGRRNTLLHFMKSRSLQSTLADSFASLSRRYPARLCRLPCRFPARGVLASCG